MTLEAFLAQFGYPALAVGILLEGETFLIIGAFMAHRGYLDLPAVIGVAFLATLLADQFFFWLGRTHGPQILARRPAWQPAVARAQQILNRNSTLLFLGFRFMYGLRTVLPFVFGMSGFSQARFAALNLLGALVWSTSLGLAGYAFGGVMEIVLEDVSRYERDIAAAIFAVGTAILLYRRWRARRSGNRVRR